MSEVIDQHIFNNINEKPERKDFTRQCRGACAAETIRGIHPRKRLRPLFRRQG